ncbi:MAG: zinc ribbon domain-containing protein, partial [Chloroflexia bacterium]|nr:zinc ribbon domain-containing protein [Chloroflexia bacterium]
MNCPWCGTANAAQARFCLACGRALVSGIVCRNCQALLPPYARYCSHCGDVLVTVGNRCPECGASLPLGQAYCGYCGSPVPQQSAPALPPQQQAAPLSPPAVHMTPLQAAVARPPAPQAVPAAPVERRTQPAGPIAPPAAPGERQLPQARPLTEMLPSLKRYLPKATYDPLERRPNLGHLVEVRDHLASLLETAKTYLPKPVVLHPQPAGQAAGRMAQGVFLFGDVSGFTPLSERLKTLGQAGAELIAEIINRLFSRLVEVLFSHGGTLLKFGGDALLGYFAADTDEEMAAGALRAVQAALAMQDVMGEFAEIDAAGEKRSLRIKCGLSAGRYFAAHIGTEHIMAYVTTGHTVNRAEQAEGHAEPGDVILAGELLPLLEGQELELEERAEGFYLLRHAPPLPAEQRSPGRFVLDEPPGGLAVREEGTVRAQITYLVDRLDCLSPYLPGELISRIVTNPGAPRISPDRRQVTVMFVNYVGISDLIDDLGESQPDVITERLNDYFVHMAEVVDRYEGTLARMDQYSVGDRLVIFFGAPRAHEDDPVRAVYTALDMQRATRDHFAALQTSVGIYRFRQRVGINTGALFAGNVGSTDRPEYMRQEYTLMGDDINMAARLMSKAEWQRIFISKKTQEQVAPFFELEDRGELKVKGKEILIPTFEVLGRRGEVGRVRGLTAGETPLIGRDEQVTLLQKCAQALLAGRGQIVSIIGESGLGKSRLLRDLRGHLLGSEQDEAPVRWLEGQSLSFSEQMSYWLARNVLVSALGLSVDAREQDILFTLWEHVETFLGKESAREAVPFLAHMLGLKLEGEWADWVRDLDPQTRQKQTFWAVREYVAAAAQQQPIVIAL